MATYLELHATRVAQGGRVRRNGAKPSGVVVIHTAENATDHTGADGGAESVAKFITVRGNYGCYHVLCDSDSTVQMAPWTWETWHDTGTNNHSVGISAAVQCSQWDELGERGKLIVKRMAQSAAAYAKWLKKTRNISIPARRITRAQSRAQVPGFLGHGESDPGRRHDPGAEFDWDLFFKEYKAALGEETLVVVHAAVKETVKAEVKAGKNFRGKYSTQKVKDIQTALAGMGRYDGLIDGDYGPMTTEAVLDYQGDQLFGGLLADGDWGPVTTRHYVWVKKLQRALNGWVGKNLVVDGDYGAKTRDRVRDVMERNHGGAYKGVIDAIPGPIFCKMLGIPVHP